MRAWATQNSAVLIGFAWAALALAPLFYASIWITMSRHDFGDLPAALHALTNSTLLAVVIGTAVWAFGIGMVFVQKRFREVIFLITVCLVVPAEIQAVGMDRFAALFRSPPLVDGVKYAGLLALMFVYVLPFVLASQLFIVRNVGRSRLDALAEYTAGDLQYALTIVRVYWPGLFGTWIIGVNIALMEVTRCTYLAVNLFGLGTEFFGPAVYDAYTSTGITKVFYLLSIATTLPVLAAIMLMGAGGLTRLPSRKISSRRARHQVLPKRRT